MCYTLKVRREKLEARRIFFVFNLSGSSDYELRASNLKSMFILVGLGNPGEEYENTRHNTGARVLDVFRKAEKLSEWSDDKKRNALISEGNVGKEKVLLVLPQTYMNKSGDSLRGLVKSKKAAEQLVVLHDDLDIPFGTFKISFDKSSGGHKGVESIIRTAKTQAFVRIRIGIAQSQAAVRKSQDELAVEKIILGKFKPAEIDELKRLSKKISEALALLVTEGREIAMSRQGV